MIAVLILPLVLSSALVFGACGGPNATVVLAPAANPEDGSNASDAPTGPPRAPSLSLEPGATAGEPRSKTTGPWGHRAGLRQAPVGNWARPMAHDAAAGEEGGEEGAAASAGLTGRP